MFAELTANCRNRFGIRSASLTNELCSPQHRESRRRVSLRIMNARRLLWTLVCTGVLLIGPGCDSLTRLWESDLEIAYLGDESGYVGRASVSTGTKVIASARRVAVRRTENPNVTELDVDESHYVRGTLDVVYTGRIVFRCNTNQELCQRIQVAPTSGTRPRDVFRQWPLKIGAPGRHPALPRPA
jgi:hypothetical protein